MKVIKEPFTNHCYIIPFSSQNKTSDIKDLKDWLDKHASGKWRIEGAGLIRILDESVETMFILKWVTK